MSMKKKIWIFFKFAALLSLAWGATLGNAYLYSYYIESRLFVWEAKRIWPPQKFEPEKFRTANLDDRFAMAPSLIEQKYGVDWSQKKVISNLGNKHKSPSRFSPRSDLNAFSYKLQNFNNPWQLVFYYRTNSRNDNDIVTSVQIERSPAGLNTIYYRAASHLLMPVWFFVNAISSIKRTIKFKLDHNEK